MIRILLLPLLFIIVAACSQRPDDQGDNEKKSHLEYGGDFSIMKKLEDLGGKY